MNNTYSYVEKLEQPIAACIFVLSLNNKFGPKDI